MLKERYTFLFFIVFSLLFSGVLVGNLPRIQVVLWNFLDPIFGSQISQEMGLCYFPSTAGSSLCINMYKISGVHLPTESVMVLFACLLLLTKRMHTHYAHHLNPSKAKSTLVQSTRMQRFLKIIKTLSCWYSLDSSH